MSAREHFRPAALADFTKVDSLTTSPEDQLRLARTYLPMKICMLAEKVETYEDFRRIQHLGYTYLQGYFFIRVRSACVAS